MKILVFGSLNYDIVYSVDSIVIPGETAAIRRVESFPGGKGLNQAVSLARAGAEPIFAGCIGNDGEELFRFLSDNGVKTHLLRCNNKTGQAFIQVAENGENSILIYHGANHSIKKEFVNTILDMLDEGDYILLQNEINLIEYIIDRAYSKKIKIILNPSPFDEKMKNIDLTKVSYLLLNEIEMASYCRHNDTDEYIRFFQKKYPNLCTVLTLGKNGCIYFDKDSVYKHSAYDVETIDTTGAGDTFTGYFVSGLGRGDSIERILKYSCAAAALAVSKKGTASSIPYYKDVKKALPTMKKRQNTTLEKQKETVDRYLSAEYAQATLSELSKKLGFSQSYTARWIKNNFGRSFTQLLIKYRCAAAAEMLSEDMSVADTAERVGYKSESFFRKIFAREQGIIPSKYRKSERK